MESDNLPLSLDEDKWWLYVRKLTLHAKNLLDGRSCQSEPVDIALEAITDICSGKRAWDREQYPNLLNHLYWVVKSKVSNLTTSAGHKAERPYDAETHDVYREVHNEETALDQKAEVREFMKGVKALLKDEKPLLDVVEAIDDCGLTERSDIAQVLGISPEEMTNRRKKLKRRLLPLIDPKLLEETKKSKTKRH